MRAASLFFAIAVTSVFTAQAEELRYRFAEGETLRYRVTQTATLSGEAGAAGAFEMKTEQVTELAWEVTAVDDDGVATIEQSVAKLRFKNSSPVGEVGFDSETDEPPMGVAAMLTPAARTLLESPVSFQVSPVGKVMNLRVPDDLLKSLGRVPGASEVIEGEPVVRSLIETVLPMLPLDDKPASRTAKASSPGLVGGLVTTFREGESEQEGVVPLLSSVTVADGAEGVTVRESRGTHQFDVAAGRLVRSDGKLSLELRVGEGGAAVEQQLVVELLR